MLGRQLLRELKDRFWLQMVLTCHRMCPASCHNESFTFMLLKAGSHCRGYLSGTCHDSEAGVINRIFISSIPMDLRKWFSLQRVQEILSPPPTTLILKMCSPKTFNDTVVFGPSSSKLCREPDLRISRRTEHQNGWSLLTRAIKGIYHISFSNFTGNKQYF